MLLIHENSLDPDEMLYCLREVAARKKNVTKDVDDRFYCQKLSEDSFINLKRSSQGVGALVAKW